MVEIILGVGHQDDLHGLLSVAEEEIRKKQGPPRQITGRSEVMEFVAKRADYKGDFTTFALTIFGSDEHAEAAVAEASKWVDVCEHAQDDGAHKFLLPKRGSTDYDKAREAVRAIIRHLRLPEVWRFVGEKFRVDRVSVELLFQAMVQYRASDVHLSPGDPPVFRVDNQARSSELMGPLSAPQILALLKELASEKDWLDFERDKQCSFSFHQAGIGYARVSAFIKAGAPHLTMRYLPEKIPSFEELNVPSETMVQLASLHRGLVLVTGMTGSGKTTTAAALVDWINSHRMAHILTIENPVEYVHRNKKSIISQRSLGLDVNSFNEGVRGALRHDPDVIVIGEMRDPDTIRAAINAAATGHLVISTLHANSASEVVNRIVSFFDPIERDLVKLQLRDCMQCVICQRLVPRKGGGRVPALEVMLNDIKAIADGIIRGDTDGIRIGMQQTTSHSFLFEQYLHRLYKQGIITLEVAREFSTQVSMFDQLHMGTYSVPRLESIKGGH